MQGRGGKRERRVRDISDTPGSSARRPWHRFLLIAALVGSIGVPILAHQYIAFRIQRGIGPALSKAVRKPTTIRSVDVALTGKIKLGDLKIGRELSIDQIEASFDLKRLAQGLKTPQQITIRRPEIRLHMHTDDIFQSRPQKRSSDAKRDNSENIRGWHWLKRTKIEHGQVSIYLPNGQLHIDALTVHPSREHLRVILGSTRVTTNIGAYAVSASFPHVAADVHAKPAAIHRLLALRGTIELRKGDLFSSLYGVSIGHRLEQSNEWVLRGNTVSRTGNGQVVVVGKPAGQKRMSVNAILQNLPGELLRPLLPAVNIGDTRVDGRILSTIATDRTVRADLDLRTKVSLDHQWLADTPVNLLAQTKLQATANLRQRNLAIEKGSIQVGETILNTTGTLSWAKDNRIQRASFALYAPQTSCKKLLDAIPISLRSDLAGFAVEGTLSTNVSFAFDRQKPDNTKLSAAMQANRCRVTRDAFGKSPSKLTQNSFVHRFPDGSQSPVGPGKAHYLSLDTLARKHLVHAFIVAEDSRFFRHQGFDLRQLERSLAVNIARNQLVRGGSTITQQLVKNVYLSPRKTIARKLQEAVLTWRIESQLSKHRILEIYLNIIELGPGVFGVGAASRYWFDKTPQLVTIREAAFLAALTPAPRPFSAKIRRAGSIETAMGRRIDTILRHLRKNNLISPAQLARAKQKRVVWKPRRLAQH